MANSLQLGYRKKYASREHYKTLERSLADNLCEVFTLTKVGDATKRRLFSSLTLNTSIVVLNLHGLGFSLYDWRKTKFIDQLTLIINSMVALAALNISKCCLDADDEWQLLPVLFNPNNALQVLDASENGSFLLSEAARGYYRHHPRLWRVDVTRNNTCARYSISAAALLGFDALIFVNAIHSINNTRKIPHFTTSLHFYQLLHDVDFFGRATCTIPTRVQLYAILLAAGRFLPNLSNDVWSYELLQWCFQIT